MKKVSAAVAGHPLLRSRPTVRQFIKFAVVGGINTLVDIGIYSLLVYLGHVYYLLANVVAFVVAVVNSYVLNRRWTFRSHDPQRMVQFYRFLTVAVIGFLVNELCLFVLVELVDVNKLLGKVMATLISFSWNFFLNRHWTFRLTTPPTPSSEVL